MPIELAADLVVGIWLQVTRGTLHRRAAPDLAGRALDAALRALGGIPSPGMRGNSDRLSDPEVRPPELDLAAASKRRADPPGPG